MSSTMIFFMVIVYPVVAGSLVVLLLSWLRRDVEHNSVSAESLDWKEVWAVLACMYWPVTVLPITFWYAYRINIRGRWSLSVT